MEVRIGIKSSNRELSLDLELETEEFFAQIRQAREEGRALEFTDRRGATYLIPDGNLAYVEVSPAKPARVGFSV